MEKDVTISARIPKKLALQVEKLSRQYQRSKSWLVEDALRGYIVAELEFIEAVEEGKKAMRNGDIISHAQVKKLWQKRKKQLIQ